MRVCVDMSTQDKIESRDSLFGLQENPADTRYRLFAVSVKRDQREDESAEKCTECACRSVGV